MRVDTNQWFRPKTQVTASKFVVVLDAGHGGKDTGNRGNGYYEKHIALNITKAIGKLQLEKDKEIKVILPEKMIVSLS